MIKDARSTIAAENLQEVLDAESSIGTALTKGQQQYVTPDWLADQCNARLPSSTPATVLDPQVGKGALVKLGGWSTERYGIELDNRISKHDAGVRELITGPCVKAFEIIDDLHPDLVFECGNSNPPFGKKWDGKDSTKVTWDWLTKHANYGYFIANHNTLVDLGIAPAPSAAGTWGPGSLHGAHHWVYHYEVHDGNKLWKGMRDTLKIGIAFWKNPSPKPVTPSYEVREVWQETQRILEDERLARPKFNIYLDPKGYLHTYLSVRSGLKLKLTHDDIHKLSRLNESHPLTLTTDKESRDLMRELVDCGYYSIQPEAKDAIESALKEVASLACPIMPVTDFETVAYADEEDSLCCITNVSKIKDQSGNMVDVSFTVGKRYPLTTGTYKFTNQFKRTKVHFDEKTSSTYTKEHDCTLTGQDRYIQLEDDHGRWIRFMDKPRSGLEFDESALWGLFAKPKVKTIAETKPGSLVTNEAILKSCGMIAGFEYYPGQAKYLSRVACKDSGLVAGETGTGKTLMALSLLAMKSPERALIVAPQGTMRSSDGDEDESEDSVEYSASQWVQEIHRFTPYLQVWEIFSYEDYERILYLNSGKLPPGVYITYYEAMFSNGARETAPESWTDEKLNKWAKAEGLAPLPAPPEGESDNKRYWCEQIGQERDGFRSIIAPCLATRIGHNFDMVLLDEAHYACNLSATRTQMLIRMQPKYRWALTATPIPNIVTNLFSLMGWIAVPEWFKGGRRNAAWPFAREDVGKFNSTFLSTERDYTAEAMKEAAARAAGEFWRGKCEKDSPVISSPARLLKLLKPSMAFCSKSDCNPGYIPPKVHDVRVPMGREQSVLYAHYLNRANVPGGHPLVRARRQTAWLRNITADPAGFTHGGPSVPKVHSNMNPKIIATLELVADLLGKGEQVLIISSRIGLSNTFQEKLCDAGIPLARIDSTIGADQHAHQAGLFKSGKARVLLMGIKCAASHSFDQCPNEIITSLEYSPGPFVQAKGRIDRVTNKVVKHIYCILHKGSIEELMFDVVATKDDAATICLRGQRVPREFKPVDGQEILAAAIEHFDTTGSTPESDCETQWPKLRARLTAAITPTVALT